MKNLNQYVLAIYSHFDGDNRIFKVYAATEADAMKEALLAHCPSDYRTTEYKNWVAGMGDTVDHVYVAAAQAELTLSNPVKI